MAEKSDKTELELVKERAKLAIQVVERVAGIKSKVENRVYFKIDPNTDTAYVRTPPTRILYDRGVDLVRKLGYKIPIRAVSNALLDLADRKEIHAESTLGISPGCINEGRAYFAEASHLVRGAGLREVGIPSVRNVVTTRVGEFYDQAGQMIGFELWKGSARLKQILGDTLYRKARKAFKNCFTNEDGQVQAKRISPEERQRTADYLREQRRVARTEPEREYGTKFDDLIDQQVEASANNGQVSSDQIDNLIATTDSLDEELSGKQKKKAMAMKKEYSMLVHRKPYAVAEGYTVEQFLSTPDFYKIPDQRVLERFFQGPGRERPSQKKGALERTAEVGLFLILPVFLAYLFFNLSSVTGFSVVESLIEMSSKSGSLVFFLAILSLAYIKLYFMHKHKN